MKCKKCGHSKKNHSVIGYKDMTSNKEKNYCYTCFYNHKGTCMGFQQEGGVKDDKW